MQAIIAESTVAGLQLVEQVGVGSAGEVWRGSKDHRIFAIKFLNTSLLQSAQREKHLHRFRNEALALKHLSDLPHIPTHYHHNLKVERPFIIMEYVDSPAFSDLMASGEMMYIPLSQRLAALERVAETLTVVHQLGIIHRDIKPSNIHGIEHPYLMDFSIGIPIRESETADRRVGTPLYQPPDLLPPSQRTDSYAFTIVVYEVLFGRHPIFDYSNVPDNADDLRQQARQAIMDEMWYRPNQLQDIDLPVNMRYADLDRLTTIFQNALMLAEDRYTSVQAFMDDVLDAIHVSENIPYMDDLPLPTDAVGILQFSEDNHFTDHSEAVFSAFTDLPDSDALGSISTRQWIIGLSLLFVILFIILVLLVAIPT